MSTTNLVQSHVSSSEATPAKRSRYDSDSSGKLSDRVAELEEDWSDLSNQVVDLCGRLRDKTLELSASSKEVETLTSSLDVERATLKDLQRKYEEATRKSSSQEVMIDKLVNEALQASGTISELQKSLEESKSNSEVVNATNLRLESDLQKQSFLANELNDKLIASSGDCFKLKHRLEKLEADVNASRVQIENTTRNNQKEIEKRKKDFELLIRERDLHVANNKYLIVANDRYRAQREELKSSLARFTKTSTAVGDVQLVNPVRDPRLKRPEPSFNVIRELREKQLITEQMFANAKNLEFEKFYPNSDVEERKKIFQYLKTSVLNTEVGDRVLVLIGCPFVVLCLRTFYGLDCTFVIRKKVKEALGDCGFKFLTYEELDKRDDRASFDLVLNDRDYLDTEVRSNFMKIKGRAFDCAAGKRSYLRRH